MLRFGIEPVREQDTERYADEAQGTAGRGNRCCGLESNQCESKIQSDSRVKKSINFYFLKDFLVIYIRDFMRLFSVAICFL